MKRTTKDSSGTSFHGDTFYASVSDLREILGIPEDENNSGEDKVNFEWSAETESGKVITVYDWKEFRSLDEDENVEWHIGGNDPMDTYEALNEIAGALNELG